ncbi:MAG: S-(hydroxymethyl)mycothiol dehydrogenase [Acidimicrobiia bacterium]
MVRQHRDERPGQGEVLVGVAGCGVCHTDLGFFYDGVPTRHALPLTLGHEISGHVVVAGEGAEQWLGREVVVPAVLPCGDCAACRAGRGMICPAQVFPGNDVHGGFGTHVRVPARGLCAVPDLADPAVNPAGLDLSALAVIADAVSTPYQAVKNAGVQPGDLAVWVGAGGVGGFGVQISAALGAHVVAIDVDAARLERLSTHGAAHTLMASTDTRALKREIKTIAASHGVPSWRWRIFETSGQPAGQALAFSLLAHGSTLAVVGYTSRTVEVRLSNLMALEATAVGTWGCAPAWYPEVVALALGGHVALEPFIERQPMSTINDVFERLHHGGVPGRIVLVPGEDA